MRTPYQIQKNLIKISIIIAAFIAIVYILGKQDGTTETFKELALRHTYVLHENTVLEAKVLRDSILIAGIKERICVP